jgi:CDP-diacylglycerol--serine O-phosphatidyltransferase
LLVTGLMMVAPCFLPKLQPHSNKFLAALQIVLVVITYLSGFFFITSNVLLQNIILTYLMILCGSYVVIGFTLGFIQRSKIIAEAEAQKKQNEAA